MFKKICGIGLVGVLTLAPITNSFGLEVSPNANVSAQAEEIIVAPDISFNLPNGVIGQDYEGTVEVDTGEITNVEGLPEGLSFDAEDNTVSGVPEEEGDFFIDVSADNDGETAEEREMLVIDGLEAPMISDQTVVSGGKITGRSQPNTTVEIYNYDTDELVEVETDNNGNFSFNAPEDAGFYVYSATATVFNSESAPTDFMIEVAESDNSDTDEGSDEGSDTDEGLDTDTGESEGSDDTVEDNDNTNDDSNGSEDEDANTDDNTEASVRDRSIDVQPNRISSSDFVKSDKGVRVNVEGFDEDEIVRMETDGQGAVAGVELIERADADGKASFHLYGNSPDRDSAYVGEYTVEVEGSEGTDDEEALTDNFVVYADDVSAPEISSNLPDGNIGEDYEGTITTDVGEITDVEGLPEGLSFNPDDNIVSGVPTKDGEFDVIITADNDGETSESTETLVINGLKAPQIEDQTVAPGSEVVGSSYPNATVEVQENNGTESPAPVEVETDENGKFSFDAPEELGSYNYSATAVAFESRSDNTEFTVNVVENATPTISVNLPEGETGKEYEGTITTDVGEITDVDNLPTGLEYDDGVVSGTPVHNGVSKVVIRAENGDKVSTETVIMIIKDPTNYEGPVDDGNDNESDKDDSSNNEDESKKKVSTGEVSDRSNNNLGYYVVGGLGLLGLVSLIGLRIFRK